MSTSFYLRLATPGSLTPRGAFDITATYAEGDLVTDSGVLYRSLVDHNSGNPPATSTSEWESAGGAVSGVTGASGTGATGASGTAATGASGTGATGAGDSHNHVFTGTAPTAAETELTSGTGFATAGQAVTTTENFTATLNQYAGCWLITATQPPCLITGNTNVSMAPLVLTVYGLAPTTDAGTWKILRAPTPSGSNTAESTHTHTGPSHTHTGPSHTHTGPSHTHTV